MQAFRKIIQLDGHVLQITLPEGFKEGEVEVIVLQADSLKEKPVLKNSQRFSGVISKETALKMHQHLNETKAEWERGTY